MANNNLDISAKYMKETIGVLSWRLSPHQISIISVSIQLGLQLHGVVRLIVVKSLTSSADFEDSGEIFNKYNLN